MICSEKELGLGEDHTGILVLDESAPIGTPFNEYIGLNDYVLEIGITPNRPDALSHIGIARELSAITKRNMCFLKLILLKVMNELKNI